MAEVAYSIPIERLERDEHMDYRVHSPFLLESADFEPKEMVTLMRWLQEHEGQLTHDALANGSLQAESEATHG